MITLRYNELIIKLMNLNQMIAKLGNNLKKKNVKQEKSVKQKKLSSL